MTDFITYDKEEFDLVRGKYPEKMFSAAFITRKSMSELADVVNIFFDHTIPFSNNIYMLITRNHSKLGHLIGQKVALKISKLFYDPEEGYIVAEAFIKNNFTCSKIPHLVVATTGKLSRSEISDHLCSKRGENATILEEMYSVQGRIGVMYNTELEKVKEIKNTQQIVLEENIMIRHTGKKVSKPELSITVDSADLPGTVVEKGPEMYDGCIVNKGPRGGKYIIKNGKKKYIKGGEGSSVSESVFTVQMVE